MTEILAVREFPDAKGEFILARKTRSVRQRGDYECIRPFHLGYFAIFSPRHSSFRMSADGSVAIPIRLKVQNAASSVGVPSHIDLRAARNFKMTLFVPLNLPHQVVVLIYYAFFLYYVTPSPIPLTVGSIYDIYITKPQKIF